MESPEDNETANRDSFRKHWVNGFKVTMFFSVVIGFAFVAGGIVTSFVYGLGFVLPAEFFFHNNRLENYWIEAFVLGAVAFGFGFVGQAKNVMLRMLLELK